MSGDGRIGGTTRYLVLQSYALILTIAEVVFILAVQLSLPGVNYEDDPLVASAFALSLVFILSPVTVLAGMIDMYSMVETRRATVTNKGGGSRFKALALVLAHVFFLVGGLSGLILIIIATQGDCDTTHKLTMCMPRPSKDVLRWQAIYALVHFPVLSFAMLGIFYYLMKEVWASFRQYKGTKSKNDTEPLVAKSTQGHRPSPFARAAM